MRNDIPMIYIGLGSHWSDSKRFFTVGTTTRKGLECREYAKHMDVLWTICLPKTKSKAGWDTWDTNHMGPFLDRHRRPWPRRGTRSWSARGCESRRGSARRSRAGRG